MHTEQSYTNYQKEAERILKSPLRQPRYAPMKGECLSVLGLEETSTLEDATSRYRELCRNFHPDISRLQRNTANEAFIVVKKAWEYLKTAHSFPTSPAQERGKGASARDSGNAQGTNAGSNNAQETKRDNNGSRGAPGSNHSTGNTGRSSNQSHSGASEETKSDRSSQTDAEERRARAAEDDAVRRILDMGPLTAFCLVEDLRANVIKAPPSPLKYPTQLFTEEGRRQHQTIKSHIELVKKGYGAFHLAKAAPKLVVKLERELASTLGVFDMSNPVDRYTYWTKLSGIAIERLEVSAPSEKPSGSVWTIKFATERESWSVDYYPSPRAKDWISPQDFFYGIKRSAPASALKNAKMLHVSGSEVFMKIGTEGERTSLEDLKRDSVQVRSAKYTKEVTAPQIISHDAIELPAFGKRINLRFTDDKFRSITICKEGSVYHFTVECQPSIVEVIPPVYRYSCDLASPNIKNDWFSIPGIVLLSPDPQQVGQSAGAIRVKLS